MPDIDLTVVLTGAGIVIFFILFRFYFVPWWSIFYEKYTISYKLAMKFIKENKELRNHLGELFEVKSIPHADFNESVLIYKFEIIGEKWTGILTIKMASKFDWYIYLAILEYDGNEFVIFEENE